MIRSEKGEDYVSDDKSIFEALDRRKKDINAGIGRRYITRTQKGFLNVHENYKQGPYCLENIAGQLTEGQIVTSIAKHKDWLHHDGGGWSIIKYEGFTFLELLDE